MALPSRFLPTIHTAGQAVHHGSPCCLVLIIVVCFLPLFVANRIDKRLDKQMERKIPSIVVWLGGIIVSVLCPHFCGCCLQWKVLMATGDFVSRSRQELFICHPACADQLCHRLDVAV